MVGACTGNGADPDASATAVSSSTTSAPGSTAAATTSAQTGAVAGFAEYGRAVVEVDGRVLEVAVADTPALRWRGLMGVADLGGLDGMLFVFETAGQLSFFMLETLIPLDIAFFDDAGSLVNVEQMEPCPAEPCARYRSAGAARWALEMPLGELAGLETGSTLTVLQLEPSPG